MQKELYEPMRFHGVETVREADTYHGMGGVGKVCFFFFVKFNINSILFTFINLSFY